MPAAQAVTFQITYTDGSSEGFRDPTFGAQRRAAFEAVVSNWGKRLTGSVPIQVSASFDNLGTDPVNGSTLAQASPYSFLRDWSNFFNQLPPPKRAATYYPIALANQQAGKDMDEGHPDIVVQCNSDWDTQGGGFYYGLDADVPNGKTDFYTVLYHEIGHGLGFSCSFGKDGSYDIEDGYASIYDIFLASDVTGSGQYLTKMTQAQRAAAFTSGTLWFAGANATLGANDASCRMFAPSVYSGGSTGSHLDEDTFHGIDELMTPVSSEPVHAPGPRVTGIFKDMGWGISATDLTAPTLTVSNPTNGAIIGSLSDVRGTATDSGSKMGRVRAKLQRLSDGLYWDGTNWAASAERRAPISGTTWSLSNLPTGANLPLGSYKLTVTAWDTANNSKTVSSSFEVADVSSPTVTISTPTENTGYNTSITATGTASANTDYVKLALRNSDGAYWEWSNGTFGSTTFSDNTHALRLQVPPTNWSYALPSLPDGDYILFASGVNTADVGSEYVARYFYVDKTGPLVEVTTPAHNSSVKALTEISGRVTDQSDIAQLTFTLYQNGQYWNGLVWTNTQTSVVGAIESDGSWSYNPNLLPKGSNIRSGVYYISATARDSLGNNSTPVSGVNQTSFRVDSSPPTCTITSPTDGSLVTSINSISGTANDDGGIDRVSLYIVRYSDGAYWDGTAWGGGGSAILSVNYNSSTGIWTSNGNLPGNNASDAAHNWTNGDYNIIAIAYDEAGNEKRADSVVTFQYSYTWTGSTLRDSDPNNNSDSWDTSANWSPPGVPGANDNAVIANGDTVQATGSHSVKGLKITGSTLNTQGLLVRNLDLNGNLYGGAVNSNGGTWNWTGGAISGTWSVLSGGTFNITNASNVTMGDNMTLSNAGIINWSGPGNIYSSGYYGPTIINNQSGGVFNLAKDGTSFSTSYGATFNNAFGAKLIKTGGTETTTLSGWTFNSSGELGSNSGLVTYSSTLNLNDKSTFTGAGKHEMTAGTLNLSGTTTVNGSAFTLSGGTLNGVGALAKMATSSGGSWNWTGGAITATIANAGTFNISGTATKTFADLGVFNNSGAVTWSGGDIYSSGYYGPFKFNNQSGATFTATSGNTFTTSYGAIFNNQSSSTFDRTGTVTSTSNWAFNNDGLAKSSAGTLALNAGGAGSGRFQTASGSFVKFTGGDHSLSGPRFLGAGKFQITGGSVTLAGDLTLGDTTSPSTLEVSGGTLIGTETKSGTTVIGNSTINSGNTKVSALNWTGGTVGGVLTWGPLLQISIADASTGKTTKTFSDKSVINNDGAVTWSGTGNIYCNAYYGPMTFNNRNKATFTFANAGTPFTTAYGSTFNNLTGARLVKSGSGTVTLNAWGFTNASEISTAPGTLEFTSSLDMNAGTKFTGTGTARFAGTINAKAPFLAAGPILLDGGNLNGVAATAFTGPTFNWAQGAINGQLTLNAGCLLTASGAGTKTIGDNAVLNNKGIVKWTGTGKIYSSGYYGPATFNNLSGATFDLAAVGSPLSTSYGTVFNNQAGAKLVKSIGSGVVTLTEWTYNNANEISTAGGTLEFLSTLNLNAGSKFTGAGAVRLVGTTNVNAPISAVGVLQLDGGNFNGNASATFTGSKFNWTKGAINGQLTLNAGSALTVSGADDKTIGDKTVFTNKGTLKWTGAGKIYSSGYYGPATFNNLSGATFDVAADGVPFRTSYGAIFNNPAGATFVKSTGAGTSTVSGWTFYNGNWDEVSKVLTLGGTVQAKTGSLAFNTNLDLRGGTVKGPGQNLWSGGTITVGAPITLDGTKLTWSAGTLNSVASGTKGTGSLSTLGTGNFNWTGGNLNGTFTLTPKSVMNVSGTGEKVIGDKSTLSNNGTITWTEGNIVCSGYYGPSTLSNTSTGVFNVRGKGELKTSYGSSFSNAGTLDLGTSVLTSNWGIAQSSTGTTKLNINSATVFGQVKTTSGVTLAGNLNATVASNYVPNINTAFKVVTHGSRTGTFGKVTVTGNSSRFFSAQYNTSDVTLLTKGYELSVNDVKVTEGTGTGGIATFTVTLSNAQTVPVTVKYATTNGTAVAPGDFTATSGSLTFAAGEKSKTVKVSIVGDTLDEDDESFTLNLSAATNAVVSDASGTGSITDDDTSLLSVKGTSVTEGNSGTKNMPFIVSLSVPNSRAVTVKYATGNAATSSATADTDYNAASGTLTFAAGETSKVVNVVVKGDIVVELNENVALLLTTPTNAAFATGGNKAEATIQNDDKAADVPTTPSLSISDASVVEGNSGTKMMLFTVRLSAASGSEITIDYATTNGTATAASDYTNLSGRLTFAPGETTKTVPIAIKGDTLLESNEQFSVALSRASNATIADGTGVGIITNDDVVASPSAPESSGSAGSA